MWCSFDLVAFKAILGKCPVTQKRLAVEQVVELNLGIVVTSNTYMEYIWPLGLKVIWG